MLFSAPDDVARTNACTLAPSSTSASVRCEPMNPSAPVTRHVRPAYTSPNSSRRLSAAPSVHWVSTLLRFIAMAAAGPKTSRSALRSGLLTGLSTLAVSGAAAGAGLLLAHEFGRNARTDGFFVAYGVYLVLAIAAQSFRTVVLPDLTRAAARGALGGETRAYTLALVVAVVPVVALVAVFRRPLADAITGRPEA